MERPNFWGLDSISFREWRTADDADGVRSGNSGEKVQWEGHPKKSAEIGPFSDHQHFLGGGSKHFYVHPYLRKWSNLTNIFQMGWNYQLVFVPICVTYGRMQLTRAKRDASNPMHLRSTETLAWRGHVLGTGEDGWNEMSHSWNSKTSSFTKYTIHHIHWVFNVVNQHQFAQKHS